MGKHVSPDRRVEGSGGGVAPRTYVIGVTGPIACGKSSVMKLLAERGAVTIDADLVYRDLVKPGMPLLQTLAVQFGPEVLLPDGGLDRHALGRIVFSDPTALAALDRITHPAISDEIERRVQGIESPLVAIEAVKLSQAGVGRLCDETWLVICDPSVQLPRLIDRNNISTEEARRRIEAQIGYDAAAFSRTITNDDDLERLREKVTQVLAESVR
ncbi:MAG: dephospho-CoA kinase [Thermomicrobiales bacterium]